MSPGRLFSAWKKSRARRFVPVASSPISPGSALAVLMPRLLDYVVAIYLRLVDAIVPNSIYHSHPLTRRVPAASPNVRTAIAVLALSERGHRSLARRLPASDARACDGHHQMVD